MSVESMYDAMVTAQRNQEDDDVGKLACDVLQALPDLFSPDFEMAVGALSVLCVNSHRTLPTEAQKLATHVLRGIMIAHAKDVPPESGERVRA